ncbi:homocysteine S-methyltransferase [Kibdelosporangium banguiense]|uniref:Homocysteine S-methyltransferase n=1 Tax=Kibdelosporangium banguiense TaxID=1365924 RepID=A0ABS4TNT5_9PSEU|nr:homocysteine S-methyltransferase [Kibdelosporangium banguiense]MBP2326073.1 homocysteine S-methyltransferase [Kibdelosporangium banguiense]
MKLNLDHPLVLDGGLSNVLTDAGHDLSGRLWSAGLLLDEPEAIAAAHLAYFRAGARVAITASYQVTYEGFAAHGVDSDQTTLALRRSIELARQAAEQAEVDHPLWIAGSVGPYGAMLADGSEYRGRYGLSVEQLVRFHRPRIEVLAEAGADVLAVETIPDVDEAEAVVRVLDEIGVPAWLSYSVSGPATRSGQPLDLAFALAAESDAVIAAGVNCCAVDDAGPAVRVAASVTGKPVVVYPNNGQAWDAAARKWTGEPTFDPGRTNDWIADGARLVGGCCQVGPDQIGALAAMIG